jgi:transposase
MFVSKVSKETKQEILSRVRAGEKVVALAKQFGLSDKTIYGWLRADTGEEVVSILKYNKLKRENEELKWLIGELTLDLKRGKKD